MIATAHDHDSIALHAYLIWDGEGRPHGRHEDHWFAAEAGLTRPAEPKAAAAVPARKAAAPRATVAKKPVAATKPVAAKRAAPAKAATDAKTPTAPAEAVVAAAALSAPRAARATARGARSPH